MQFCELLDTDIHLGKLFTKCPDLGIGVLGATVDFAFGLIGWRHDSATSSYGIRGVLLGIARVEVIGIDARWSVALMKTIEAIRDRAFMEFVGESMRLNSASVDANLPVSMLILATRPVPAIIRAAPVNLGPEAIFGGFEWSNLVVVTDDKSDGLSLDVSKPCVIPGRNWGWLTTAAFTEFYRGFVRGMIAHAKFSFQNLAMPRAISSSAVVSLLA